MRVLVVTGSRHGTRHLDRLSAAIARAALLLTGGAEGVDEQAEEIAAELGIHTLSIKALWKKLGRAGGPRRNSVLAFVAEVFKSAGHEVTYIGFPDPDGSGTQDAMRKLAQRGVAGESVQ